MSKIVQQAMEAAVRLAPGSWLPGGEPDPLARRKHGLVGASVSRIDGPLKVSGKARFAAEFPLEGMTFAALAYATVPKGRIAAIDTSAAEGAPGVVLVMTHLNAPRMKAPPAFMTAPKAAAGDDHAVMQDDRIHWNGQPIAVVLAETQEQADHAVSLLRTSYEVEPAVTVFADAKKTAHPPQSVLGQPPEMSVGDADKAFEAAAMKVDLAFTTPRHNHNPIELHAATLAWTGDDLVIHDATQAVAHVAWTMAQVFGIDEGQVHVTSPYVGGGFGSKTLWRHHILAAAAAKLAGRPVRIVLSREGVYRVVGGRSNTEQRVAIGASVDGRLEALIHTGVTAMTTHNNMPEPFLFATQCLYGVPNIRLAIEVADMDMLANTFMRAPGEAVGTFATECALDELAEKLKLDPIELRIRNEPDKDPMNGAPFSSRLLADAYRAGAERFGWEKRNAEPGSRREGEWLVGIGCASATYPYHRMPGGAARLVLRRDGSVYVGIAAHEMGMGTATVHTQIVAERLGLPMEKVVFAYGDSKLPGLVLAGGSQQTASIGAAIIDAQSKLVPELLKLAGNDSALAGLSAGEIEARDGGLGSVIDPQRFESYASILSRANRDEVAVDGEAPQPLEATHWSMHSYGAVFAEVRVNAVTGEPRVSRILGSYDCGRILNPKMARSQFRGGIIMGLGLALMEETLFDERTGRVMNPSLAEYHVPVHLDVPEIDIIWTDAPDPHAPMGARGIGEIGITGVGAAVANAVYNATGKRARDLPITLDKLM